MKSSPVSFAATVLLAVQYTVADPVPAPMPSTTIQLKAMTSEGCYSSSTGMTYNTTYIYQTSGYCQPLCVEIDRAVLGLTAGDQCYCGDELPPTSSKVNDTYCNVPCAGYDLEMCGGDGYYSVYLSGTKIAANVKNADPSSSSALSSATGSATASAQPSVVTVGGATIIVTPTGSVSNTSTANGSKSSSKAGIAAGVVVGVVAVIAIAGGLFFFMRARKRREIEEEHRRNAAVNSFVHSGKPQSSAGSSFADARLDQTAMAQRRMSDGSIADNQDYSRRILKVTNA